MEIEETVKRFIISELMMGKRDEILENTFSLIENGVLDSLGIMRLIQFIEEDFSFSIEDEDILPENFENIESISHFIKRSLSKNHKII
jgi:acyl carrier protein